MKAQTFKVSTPEEILPAIDTFRKNTGMPTLAIVFASVAHSLEQIQHVFRNTGIAVFGASSSGEVADTVVCEESIVFMLLDIVPDVFQLAAFEGYGRTSYQLGQQVGDWARTTFANPALLLLSAGLQADGEQIVRGVIDAVGYELPLFGGLAGDDLRMQGTYVFSRENLLSLGALALLFDSQQIELNGTAVSGWRGIGTPKTITRSEGNIVYEIDGEPALDVYARYLNLSMGSSTALNAEHPLLLLRDDGAFVLRAAMIINPDKSMVYAGSVPQGSRVLFSMPPGFEITDHALEGLQEFRKITPEVDAVLMFSCKARHLALGPIIDDEISAVYQLWQMPMVGFFTYGEIGPNSLGHCDFHNDTLSMVLLRQKA